ncbi:hypothetical protein GGS21DRAFT_486567 [Xylaria nigripes]|nr:hypothetical protein GGS21DRAFT_486567 [Xylaria nigripes]
MQTILVSLVAILAATGVATPVPNEPRQLPGLGGLTSPLTGVLSQVGKHVPSALGRLNPGDKSQPKNGTQPATGKKPSDGLGGALGGLGGLGELQKLQHYGYRDTMKYRPGMDH